MSSNGGIEMEDVGMTDGGYRSYNTTHSLIASNEVCLREGRGWADRGALIQRNQSVRDPNVTIAYYGPVEKWEALSGRNEIWMAETYLVIFTKLLRGPYIKS